MKIAKINISFGGLLCLPTLRLRDPRESHTADQMLAHLQSVMEYFGQVYISPGQLLIFCSCFSVRQAGMRYSKTQLAHSH